MIEIMDEIERQKDYIRCAAASPARMSVRKRNGAMLLVVLGVRCVNTSSCIRNRKFQLNVGSFIFHFCSRRELECLHDGLSDDCLSWRHSYTLSIAGLALRLQQI